MVLWSVDAAAEQAARRRSSFRIEPSLTCGSGTHVELAGGTAEVLFFNKFELILN